MGRSAELQTKPDGKKQRNVTAALRSEMSQMPQWSGYRKEAGLEQKESVAVKREFEVAIKYDFTLEIQIK